MKVEGALPGGGLVGVVGGGEHGGLPADLDDVGEAGEAQPVVEERGVEVIAVRQGCAGLVDATGVDHGGLLAADQAAVAGVGGEAEQPAGLADDVDPLLKDIRHAGVPHGHREEVGVRCCEAVEHGTGGVPLALLLRAGLAAPEDGHLGFGRETAESRELPVEQVKLLHVHIGVRPTVSVQERTRKGAALARCVPRASGDVQQCAHETDLSDASE